MLVSGPSADELEAIRGHFSYWQNEVELGRALIVGRTQTTHPDTMGLAIFRAESEADAQRIAATDPAVVAGVFQMQLHPYHIALLGEPAPFRP
jgi:uncharacterized protein YciI